MNNKEKYNALTEAEWAEKELHLGEFPGRTKGHNCACGCQVVIVSKHRYASTFCPRVSGIEEIRMPKSQEKLTELRPGTKKRCLCGCRKNVRGKQKYHGPNCRKRMSRTMQKT
jgi:hypothetical protein